MTQKKLEEFIVHNSKIMDINDMADETGHSYFHIRAVCLLLGIAPIRKIEVKLKFLRDNHLKLTAVQAKRMLGVCERYFVKLCKQANIPLTAFKKELQEGGLTPGQILSGYQVSAGVHYYANAQLEQDLLDKMYGELDSV